VIVATTASRSGDLGDAPTSAPARILIADADPSARARVRDALESAGLAVCAEAGDASAAVASALRERPDVCLLDVRMPGGGVTAAWEITARLPETKVVMLAVSPSDAHLFASLHAGASGYLPKDIDPARLPLVLQGVLNGEAALPRTLVARLLEEFRDRAPRRRVVVAPKGGSQLTSREWQVLELLREGLSTAEIAERLAVAPVTVRSHVAAIRRKLRAPDRAAAIRFLNGRQGRSSTAPLSDLNSEVRPLLKTHLL
jgi:DNA-binding NarL/FixJ family response regulator